jgi:hypothetical protein
MSAPRLQGEIKDREALDPSLRWGDAKSLSCLLIAATIRLCEISH